MENHSILRFSAENRERKNGWMEEEPVKGENRRKEERNGGNERKNGGFERKMGDLYKL